MIVITGIPPAISQNSPNINYSIDFNSHWITGDLCENYSYGYSGDMIYSILSHSTANQDWQITSNNEYVNETGTELNFFSNSSQVQNEDEVKSNLKELVLFPIESVFVCKDPKDIAQMALNTILMINSEHWAKSFFESIKPRYSYYNISTPIWKIHLHEMEAMSITTPGDQGIGPFTYDPYDIFQYGLFLWQSKFDSKYNQNGVTHTPSLSVDNYAKLVYSSGSISYLNLYTDVKGSIDKHKVDIYLNLTIVNQDDYNPFQNESRREAIIIDFFLWNFEWIIPVIIVILSIGIYHFKQRSKRRKEPIQSYINQNQSEV